MRTVVAADKCVAILCLQLSVHILFRLLHRNVHVPVEACKHTYQVQQAMRQNDSRQVCGDAIWLNNPPWGKAERENWLRTAVINARVQLDDDGSPNDCLQELCRAASLRHADNRCGLSPRAWCGIARVARGPVCGASAAGSLLGGARQRWRRPRPVSRAVYGSGSFAAALARNAFD